MANIKRGELEFLISLCDKISSISGMSDDAHRLQEIVNRLSAAEEAKLRRTWDAICEKRKVDPTYGRSAKECDRIENKKKNSNIFNNPNNQFSQSGVIKVVDDESNETTNFRYDVCVDDGSIRRFIVKHNRKTVYMYPEFMPEDKVVSTAVKWCIKEFRLNEIDKFIDIERMK